MSVLNDEPCIVRSTLIDLNPVELKNYPFMISLDKCTRMSYLYQKYVSKMCFKNVLPLPKICVSKVTKDTIVKAFNILTNKNEAKCNDKTYFM